MCTLKPGEIYVDVKTSTITTDQPPPYSFVAGAGIPAHGCNFAPQSAPTTNIGFEGVHYNVGQPSQCNNATEVPVFDGYDVTVTEHEVLNYGTVPAEEESGCWSCPSLTTIFIIVMFLALIVGVIIATSGFFYHPGTTGTSTYVGGTTYVGTGGFIRTHVRVPVTRTRVTTFGSRPRFRG